MLFSVSVSVSVSVAVWLCRFSTMPVITSPITALLAMRSSRVRLLVVPVSMLLHGHWRGGHVMPVSMTRVHWRGGHIVPAQL
jgi:hypothetical protein